MTNYRVILDVAKTHLLSRKKSTLTAALGVTFGIASYITLVSFMSGLNQMLDDLILDQTPHIHLYNEIEPSERQPADLLIKGTPDLLFLKSVKPKQETSRIRNALPILQDLRKDPAVLGVSPQVRAQVFYLSGTIELGGTITGIDIAEEIRLTSLKDYITQGSDSELEQTDNGIILGIGLGEKMSLQIRDRIQVSTTKGEIFPLKVVGFYQSGVAEIDNVQSFVSLQTVQRMLGEPNSYITDMNVKLHDVNMAPALAQILEKRLGITATDIREANAQYETGTSVRNLITYAVSVTLLIVAGFGIYNILSMLIYEKMNDIAILKATGFSGTDVQLVFMAQALIIGIAGGLLGLGLGYALAVLIDHTPFETEALPTISTYPVLFNPVWYIIGIAFALLATTIAGYLPSVKAKRIDPVEILRGA